MEEGPRSVNRFAAPIKSLAQRFAFMALVLAAFALLMLGKVNVTHVEILRAHVTDAMAPILDVVSRPVDTVEMAIAQVRELYVVREENTKLREEKNRLIRWQTVARKLEAENSMLRDLLNFEPGPDASFITARVIADTGGVFAHSLVLNAGERAGVRKGQAAVTGDGLVGRVAGVGSRSSRLLLITDLNSRIPVVIEPERTRAILAGNNTDRPRLIHLPPGAGASEGDRVVTSGHGGAFPAGLPVGVVASVNESGIGVQPFVARNRLEFVRILDYGLSGIVHLPAAAPPMQKSAPPPDAAGELAAGR